MASFTSSVAKHLKQKILLTGPVTVAEYMKVCLTSPGFETNVSSHVFSNPASLNIDESKIQRSLKHDSSGYYMSKDVFGQGGDFITSPEISQMFGEMVGIWGIDTWKRIGGPKSLQIVELGPGRGTLARDVLKIFKNLKYITGSNVSLHMVEVSPYLASVQQNCICGQFMSRYEENETSVNTAAFYSSGQSLETGVPVYWYDSLQTVPRGFSFYIAHEFFDALPIHKIQKTNGEWREVLVDLCTDHISSDSIKLRFVISKHETPAIKLIKSKYPQILRKDRDHMEVCLVGFEILRDIVERLNEFGGLFLLVDYGHTGNKGDTFRSFYKHQLHDPLVDPGKADLTADVDFSHILSILNNDAFILGPISQRDFLKKCGIELRFEKLMETCNSEKDKADIQSGYNMIINEMGERFKVIGFLPDILKDYVPQLKISGFG